MLFCSVLIMCCIVFFVLFCMCFMNVSMMLWLNCVIIWCSLLMFFWFVVICVCRLVMFCLMLCVG